MNHRLKKMRIVNIIILSLTLLGLLSHCNIIAQSCKQYPLANIDSKVCNGDKCTLKTLTSFYSPITPLYESCLKFTDATSDYLNIRISLFEFESRSSYCYYSDSPIMSSTRYCGCYAVTQQSCPCTGNLNGNFDAKSCVHWDVASKSCTLTGRATFCSNLGFTGAKRFKICAYERIKDAIGSVTVTRGNMSFVGEINNDGTMSMKLPDGTEISMVATPTLNVPSPMFTILDVSNSDNFYIGDNSVVNALSEYNYDKIGWYKTDATDKIGPNIGSVMSVHIEDCSANKYSLDADLLMIDEYLASSPHLLSQNREPYSHIIDSKFPEKLIGGLAIPSHLYGRGYTVMKEGILFFASGGIYPLGFTINGQISVLNWEGVFEENEGQKMTSCGMKDVTSWDFFALGIGYVDGKFSYVKAAVDQPRRCVYYWYQSFNDVGQIVVSLDMNEGFPVQIFPSLDTVTFKFIDNSFTYLMNSGPSDDMSQKIHLMPHSGLALVTIKGSYDVVIDSGKDCKVSFKSCNESHCLVDVKNGPCTCLISDSKNILSSNYKLFGSGEQIITLTSHKNFTGYTDININCGDNDFSSNIYMNRTINPYTGNSSVSANDTKLANSLFDKISALIDSIIGNGEDTFLSYIIDIIVFVIIGVLSLIITGIIIYVIILIVPYALVCCRRIKPMKGVSLQKREMVSSLSSITPEESKLIKKFKSLPAYRYSTLTEILNIIRSGDEAKLYN